MFELYNVHCISSYISIQVIAPEPMETNLDPDSSSGTGATSTGSSPNGKSADIVMESTTNPPTPASGMQVEPPDGGGGSLTKAESTTMLCEPNSPELPHTKEVEEDSDLVSEKDLELICDLFYLPCEHGPKVRTARRTKQIFFDIYAYCASST